MSNVHSFEKVEKRPSQKKRVIIRWRRGIERRRGGLEGGGGAARQSIRGLWRLADRESTAGDI